MRVLVIGAIAPEGVAYLRERGIEVDEVSDTLAKGELYGRLGDYDGVITRSSTAVTAEFLARANKLRILGRAGVGVDNIDVDACSHQGVIVVNAPHGNVVSAAEHTVGMLLALLRKIPVANDALKRLQWDRGIYGSELYRKTVGVLGLGKVGSRVATRLRAFDMSVLVYDPYIPESRARELGVRLTDLRTVLAEADVITVHVPLSDETESLLGAREIALMKPGVRIVNCARGGIVHEGALLAALESGHVAGAAVDVWSEEPPVSDLVKRLITHPHVVVTPHLGANTHEAQINVAVDVAREIVAFRDGELVEHAVNVPVGDRETMAAQRPFLVLAETLGRFCVQLEPDNVERVDVVVAGQVARRDPELIARAVLKGLLEPVTAQAVNLVNAHLVARERGLEIAVHTDEEAGSGYTNLITVTTQAGEARKILAGTVFDGVPRIVRLKDLHIEFIPEGHILVLSYEDRPGVVGKIGSILGRHNVNIASMHVGRRTKRGRAIVVLLLDENVPDEVIGGGRKGRGGRFRAHRPVGTMSTVAAASRMPRRRGVRDAPVGWLRDDRGRPGVQGQAPRRGARRAPEPAAASASRRELDRGQRCPARDRLGAGAAGPGTGDGHRAQGRVAPDRKPRTGPGGHHRGPAWAVSRRGRHHPPPGRLWARRCGAETPRSRYHWRARRLGAAAPSTRSRGRRGSTGSGARRRSAPLHGRDRIVWKRRPARPSSSTRERFSCGLRRAERRGIR